MTVFKELHLPLLQFRLQIVPYNAQQIIAVAKQAAEKQVSAIVFPELCLTGYTCGDLFFQQTLLTSALNGLETILKELKQRRYHLHCWSAYQSGNKFI